MQYSINLIHSQLIYYLRHNPMFFVYGIMKVAFFFALTKSWQVSKIPVEMKRDKIWYLRRMKLFKDLHQEEMERIEKTTRMKRTNRKDHIFISGEEGRFVYFMTSGRIRVYRKILRNSSEDIRLLH